ncbi:glycosyltransferase family 2 protein [Oceanomicrobium pacificus]|uniref:Glycosyltransferase n=1 Tax=Oceanomicrobium pacificus TaxID=2692916 RepID=A0A6B0U0N7_9RHOB|nr:glycosyltransferase [Oceanomicrobium pacificus]MXU64691.1 glycosyltransferase [Oceanomicrobium pacificus]
MTPLPPVSLVIVSRDRAAELDRLLSALRFQTVGNVDLVLVTNGPAPDGPAPAFRHIRFDAANIAAARNRGWQAARGDLVFFIDDDAIPEPRWLERMISGFADPSVGQVGGRTLRRNGVDIQFDAALVGPGGADHPAPRGRGKVRVLNPANGLFPRVMGTNMGFRRDTLLMLGGFDEGYRFFLDETDLSLRLGRARWATAYVPSAQVQHFSASSNRRSPARVPRDLTEIGASMGLFLARHAGAHVDAARDHFLDRQEVRLRRFFALGYMSPAALAARRRELRDGLKAGADRARTPPPSALDLPAPSGARPATIRNVREVALVPAGPRSRRAARAEAARLAADGIAVTCLDFRPSPLFLQVRFDPAGFWSHRGGIWGRGNRRDPLIAVGGRTGRVQRELARLAGQRKFSEILTDFGN